MTTNRLWCSTPALVSSLRSPTLPFPRASPTIPERGMLSPRGSLKRSRRERPGDDLNRLDPEHSTLRVGLIGMGSIATSLVDLVRGDSASPLTIVGALVRTVSSPRRVKVPMFNCVEHLLACEP